MVTDRQVRRLRKFMHTENTRAAAANKAGIDEKTARKYLRLDKLPSELVKEHKWATRKDPFSDDWPTIRDMLMVNPGLEAKTIFQHFQRLYPGKYQDGQLRTLQRRVKVWRALEGPPKEIFFPQDYEPGRLCESDFTHMNELGITVQRQPFNHLVYHFVLPYSNWETGTICFSECFEALSNGLQSALWQLGGIPQSHRTDRLTTAVNKTNNPEEFTQRYKALLRHYKLKGEKIQAGHAHENGDVEQRHFRFKRALDQSLMLRSSRDFDSRKDYADYLKKLFSHLNAGRKLRLQEEQKVLRRLPLSRFDCFKRIKTNVRKSSTINVNHNVYSVDSRLIGEHITVRLHAEHLEIWYAQRCVDTLPRLRGEGNHSIEYRHVIDWLVRKPGAFANYRYKSDLFPTHRFRMAYDYLNHHSVYKADWHYLKILELAAKQSETAVDNALAYMVKENIPIHFEAVAELLKSEQHYDAVEEVTVDEVDISVYDTLLSQEGVAV